MKLSRPNDLPARLVINQTGVPKRPEIPVKDFAEAVGVTPDLVLPFDPQLFGEASNNGQMVAEVDDKSASVALLKSLAALLTGRTDFSNEKKKDGLLGFLKLKKRSA